MGLKGFILGLVLAIGITACSGVSFLYKFYIFDYENNMLRGSKPVDDLKTDVCAVIPDNKYKCVIMKLNEFFRLKADYEKQKQRIIDLERRLNQCKG